jgi:hypothetical protein
MKVSTKSLTLLTLYLRVFYLRIVRARPVYFEADPGKYKRMLEVHSQLAKGVDELGLRVNNGQPLVGESIFADVSHQLLTNNLNHSENMRTKRGKKE